MPSVSLPACRARSSNAASVSRSAITCTSAGAKRRRVYGTHLFKPRLELVALEMLAQLALVGRLNREVRDADV